MEKARYTDLTLYKRLFYQARPYWPHIGGIFFVRLLAPPLALLAALPLKFAVDSVIDPHPLPDFLYALSPKATAESRIGILLVVTALAVGLNFFIVA